MTIDSFDSSFGVMLCYSFLGEVSKKIRQQACFAKGSLLNQSTFFLAGDIGSLDI
jgi:hypothetical protein